MMRELSVDLGEARSYPIYIGENILEDIVELFKRRGIPKGSPLLIVTDNLVAPHYLDRLTGLLETGGYKVLHTVVPAGEQSKSLEVFEQVITAALQGGLDRNSTIIALGGGVVGDLAGFSAASYMRGVRFVQIPTTVLAHDSSVGGKVAVNHRLAKNIIGAFHQPQMVVYDTATLKSLPEREVRAGLSEVVKHGLIWDREFVAWCGEHSEELLNLQQAALQHALYEGCRIKSLVVSQDERESGLRAVLNLGHTIGHALEAVAKYQELLHGEAISIGMVGAAILSVRMGNPEYIYTETKKLLQKFRLPVSIPEHMDTEAIMRAMMHDKKFKEGTMVFVIPADIGKVEIRGNIPADWVRETIEQLKKEA
ncbi:3-dehydroquinate synthase [Ferviditalea candida]|uniref:3-dehydroquinate synthase n=1 Tax=Ferviditalea candida TaxID=3108399 RepID=A0ABU5ZMT9_9BACL|nr:3-dehydroquinate synthase [Paenibacillaceae bacterium T2]